jgi:hypothetical protein
VARRWNNPNEKLTIAQLQQIRERSESMDAFFCSAPPDSLFDLLENVLRDLALVVAEPVKNEASEL